MDAKANAFDTVLITGASSGIGAALAEAFATKGAALSLTGRNKVNLSKVAEKCKNLGAQNVIQIVADLSDREGIEKIVQETVRVYDKLDVLVNNAGLYYNGLVADTTFETFDTLCNVNVRAPFFLSQMCIPYLEKTQGKIINVSSIGSRYHVPVCAAYFISKAMLNHFTKTAALELSEKGIRVNAIEPGVVHTNVFANADMGMGTDEFFAVNGSLTPLNKRNVEVDEVADVVLFLSSDAAKMITGACLTIDGGRSLAKQ